jgi:DNA polymerase I-like protein with 3'-5' exonuclease and polymerase domains
MPNLQNIPSRDEHWGPRIRALFLPDEGCSWVRHDWSQIEYRFLAHVGVGANANEVQKLYRDDPTTDFHQMVLDMIGWGPEMRKPAKNINFGLVYGMGTKLLAANLGMSVEQAKSKIFDVYHSKVPFVRDTYDRAAMLASTRGYVKTVYGRRARFPLFEPSSGWSDDVVALPEDEARAKWGGRIRRAFTHKALNRVLQGSAADLMKIAMRDIWKSGVYDVLPVAHLTVHDELDHSCPPGEAANAAVAEVRHLMENAMKLRVPILAAEERGPSWGECE